MTVCSPGGSLEMRPIHALFAVLSPAVAGAAFVMGCSHGRSSNNATALATTPPTPTGQYVDGAVEGATGVPTKIFVETIGSPTKPAIVFFHGLTNGRRSWDPQFLTASPLRDHFYLVRIDERGHGDSGKPLDPNEYLDGKKWADEIGRAHV